MNPTASTSTDRPLPRFAAAQRPATPRGPLAQFPPILPVVLPLVIAAIVIGVVFARVFPVTAVVRAAPAIRFTNVTEASGIHFVHHGGVDEPLTTLGGAVVVLDYDRDGRPDLFFVNGTAWPWEERAAWTHASACALYHNDGAGHFTDVSRTAGLDLVMQGMSATAGDYDDDGYPDLFVTGVGQCRLLHNQRDGTFADVTDAAGVGGDEQTWSTGATWIDIDGDGKLDLVVAHYARWPQEVGLSTAFGVAAMGRSYGAPMGFVGVAPSVYHNLGNGTFALVRDSAGLKNIDPLTGLPVAKALAVRPVDINGDGKLDLLFSYHANDGALFVNQGDGTFRKWTGGGDRHEGASAGVASASALPFATGVETDETLAVLEAMGALDARTHDDARAHLDTKQGVALLDYDLDGHLDAFSGDGRAEPDVNKFEADRQFAAAPRVLWNPGDGRLVPAPGVTGTEGDAWTKPIVARGIAVLDIDGDGDDDVVIAQNNGPALVLRNDHRDATPWLRIRLVATRGSPDAGGARVEV
ncbi:MAG TPA: VCBS repeat-containing protein, partial [Candidatus Didemnitutus sp.]|nr:VCBS repeat-containing protein [Candidatus Didemnitutus sp.]